MHSYQRLRLQALFVVIIMEEAADACGKWPSHGLGVVDGFPVYLLPEYISGYSLMIETLLLFECLMFVPF